MIARGIAAALLAGAIVLYSAVAVPMRRQAAAAADDYRRARDEARDMRARLARLERRDAAHLRAATALAGATPAGTVQRVRRSVVQALLSARVSGVRLGVTAARAPYAARVHLTAVGPGAVALLRAWQEEGRAGEPGWRAEGTLPVEATELAWLGAALA